METVSSSAESTDHEDKFDDREVEHDDDSGTDSAAHDQVEVEDTDKPAHDIAHATQEDSDHGSDTDQASSTNFDQVKDIDHPAPTKSPLLTARRMSRDFVEENKQVTGQDTSSSQSTKSSATIVDEPEVASKEPPVKSSPRPSRFTLPWGAPSKRPADPRSTSPQRPSQTKKASGTFSWLGRASTAKLIPMPPVALSRGYSDTRRNTTASTLTIGGNSDLLAALDDGVESPGSRSMTRSTLKDQFKMLRLREEVGITSLEEPDQGGSLSADALERVVSRSLSVGSPSTHSGEKDEVFPLASPTTPPVPVDPNLAPGTVSGIATAPSNSAIDWDFWQTVVNEGPQAVARTSPEELTEAIANGIPQTIRGVIWQVMANSQNKDLEGVYQDLKMGGPSQELKENGHVLAANGNPTGSLKESTASSASSVHSEKSTPATSATVGVTSPSPSQDSFDVAANAKLQVTVAASRQKKDREDAASLAKLEKMIRRDMGSRTSYSKYAVAAGFQDSLFNLCKSYALFDEAVGYPQGLNFIIMPLLFTMPEDEAFCLLVSLMNKYHLRDLFVTDMPGLHLHLYQFERLLEDLEPALYCHLNRRGATPKLYATQWFLTMFAYRFPLQLVMRVYDLVLSGGLEGAILKFGMAVVQRNVNILLGMNDMLSLTNFLKEKIFDVYIDPAPSSKSILESGFFGNSGGTETEIYRADLLVQDACAVKVTPTMLAKYRQEWEEQLKATQAREMEFEELRHTVSVQNQKIRSLEDRAEKSDRDHVALASEVVRTKVVNQELTDANESLKGQVDELTVLVDSQGAIQEAKMKGEMERVLARNAEVQNLNRQMEENLEEMERNLVQTKVSYAEITAEHETLKQKWSDLRKALE